MLRWWSVARLLRVVASLVACTFACSGSTTKPGQDGNATQGGAGKTTTASSSGGSANQVGSGGGGQVSSGNGGSFGGCETGASCSGGASDAGACAPECAAGCIGSQCLVCAPNSSRCVANAVVTCSKDGTSESRAAACTGGVCIVSGGQATCKSYVCTPDQTFCAPEADRVLQCASDGFSSAVAEDCAASGTLCDNGVCVPLVCTAGQRYCDGSSVRLCNSRGTASSLTTTCSSTQHCSVSPSLVGCVANVCTPSSAVCDGSRATTCSGDGSGYMPGGVDCTAAAQVCSAGTCLAPVCTPGVKTCKNNTVVQCNVDSLTTSVIATCSATQYCDPQSVLCQAKVCEPNLPVCIGSVATQCDGLGAAVLPGGTDCAPNHCSSGACTTALFFEDFEDGDYAGWWEPVPSDNTRTVVTNGADGTTHSLCMTRVGSGTVTSTGVMYTLKQTIQPTYMSWWVRPLTKYSNFFELYPTGANSGAMVWQLYDQTGNIALVSSPSDILVPHTLTWYHTEIKNISWTQHTFDYYIDGRLIAAGVAFRSPGNQFGLIDYFHAGSGTGGCIDQILMK